MPSPELSESSKHPLSVSQPEHDTGSSMAGSALASEAQNYTRRMESDDSDTRFYALKQFEELPQEQQLALMKQIQQLNQKDVTDNQNLPTINFELGLQYPSEKPQIDNVRISYWSDFGTVNPHQADEEGNEIALILITGE